MVLLTETERPTKKWQKKYRSFSTSSELTTKLQELKRQGYKKKQIQSWKYEAIRWTTYFATIK